MTDEERAWEAMRAEILRRQSLEPTVEDRAAVRRLSDRLVETMTLKSTPQPKHAA